MKTGDYWMNYQNGGEDNNEFPPVEEHKVAESSDSTITFVDESFTGTVPVIRQMSTGVFQRREIIVEIYAA